jgi:hypothetical protein
MVALLETMAAFSQKAELNQATVSPDNFDDVQSVICKTNVAAG